MSEQPEQEPGSEIPDLEEILRQAQGITPDTAGAISAMAAIHAEWRRAWLETGTFSEQETFEMTCILVCVGAGGLRSAKLPWLSEGRTSHRCPDSEAGNIHPGQECEQLARRALPPDRCRALALSWAKAAATDIPGSGP